MFPCRPLILLITLMTAFAHADKSTDTTPLANLRDIWRAFFNHDGSRVLVQLRGGEAGLWDVASGRHVTGDIGAMKVRGDVLMAPGATRFAAGFQDGTVRVFDASSAKAISPELKVVRVESGMDPMKFSPDLRTLVVFDADQRANVFDVESGRELAQIAPTSAQEANEDSRRCQFSNDGKSFFILDTGGTLVRYNTSDWKAAGKPMTHPNRDGYWFAFDLSRDGKYALTSDGPGENGPKGYLQLWDLQKEEPIGEALKAQNGLSGRFLPGGKRLLITPSRGLAAVYGLPGLGRLFDLPRHDDVEGPRVTGTRDGQWLLTSGNAMLHVCDALTGKVEGFNSNKTLVSNVLVFPDSKHCYAVYNNTAFEYHADYYVMKLGLPKLKTEASIRILSLVEHVELSPDGSRLLTMQGDQLRVFDAATLQEILPH